MLSSFPWFQEVSRCHGVNITPFFLHSVFRWLTFHATNPHIWWVFRTLLQKLCIQTQSLFACGSRESEDYTQDQDVCVHTCRSFQKISDQRNRTITVTGQSSQQAMANTMGAKSSIIDVNPLEDTNTKLTVILPPTPHLFKIIHVWMISLLYSMKPHRRH